MRKFARSNLFVVVLVALCALLAVATLRATAQQLMSGPKRALAQQDSAPDSPAGTRDAAAAPPASTPAPPATPPTPPKPPAGSGGIRLDDATVAPDKGQSADNNVSFPTDI